ncbi:MAG TPA: hypothetical protein DCY86_14585 [Bdellovibrionales bacterium]|nr:hypothetical protein [Bdellovibrionales bacterium]
MNKKFLALQIAVIFFFAALVFELIPRPAVEGKRLYTKSFSPSFAEIQEESPDFIKLSIGLAGLLKTDLEGNSPAIIETFKSETGKSWNAQSGGTVVLNQYLQILREKYGEDFLLLSMGGVFQATNSVFPLQDLMQNFQAIQADFEKNSQFNWPGGLPWVASNVYSIGNKSNIITPSVNPYLLLERRGLRILIVSLSEADERGLPGRTLTFNRDPVGAFTQIRQSFGKNQPNLIIVLYRGDGLCVSKHTDKQINWGESEGTDLECNKNKGPFKFLRRLPPGTVHLLALTDPYNAFGVNSETPVLQVGDRGKYIGMIDFFFDRTSKILRKEKTRFHSFIKTCHFFHPETLDCTPTSNYIESETAGAVTKYQKPALFYGQTIQAPGKN